MPNFNPVNTLTETNVQNGEIVGAENTQKRTGFWSKVGSIFGGIANAGIGIITGGGIGGVVGNLLGSGNSTIEQMNRVHQDNMKSSAQLIMFQSKVHRSSEEFAAISNLLKSRHDSEMQAVNNMKS